MPKRTEKILWIYFTKNVLSLITCSHYAWWKMQRSARTSFHRQPYRPTVCISMLLLTYIIMCVHLEWCQLRVSETEKGIIYRGEIAAPNTALKFIAVFIWNTMPKCSKCKYWMLSLFLRKNCDLFGGIELYSWATKTWYWVFRAKIQVVHAISCVGIFKVRLYFQAYL